MASTKKLSKGIFTKEFILYLLINLFGYMGLAIANAGVTWYIEKVTHDSQLVALFLTLSILFSFVGLIFFNKLLSNKNLFSVLKGACFVQLVAIAAMTLFASLAGAAMAEAPYMLTFILVLSIINAPAIYVFQIVSRGIVDTKYLPMDRAAGNSVIELGCQIAGIIGAICLGAMYNTFGVLTFISVVVSMAIAIALVCIAQKTTNTDVKQANAADDAQKDEKVGTKKSLRYLGKHVSLLIFGILVWAPTVVVAITNSAFPSYVDDMLVSHLHDAMLMPHSEIEAMSTYIFSASQIAYAVGGIIMSLVTAFLLKKARITVPLMWILFLAALSVMLFVPETYAFLGATAVMASSIVFLRIFLNTSLMELVPKHMYTSILFVLTALGTLVQGAFTQLSGILTANDTVLDSFILSFIIVIIAWIVTGVIGAKHDLIETTEKNAAR